jgi:hypothetical protein
MLNSNGSKRRKNIREYYRQKRMNGKTPEHIYSDRLKKAFANFERKLASIKEGVKSLKARRSRDENK